MKDDIGFEITVPSYVLNEGADLQETYRRYIESWLKETNSCPKLQISHWQTTLSGIVEVD